MPDLIAINTEALAEVLRRLDRIERAVATRPPEWVSIAAYAAQQGVTRRTVLRWIDAGSVEAKGAGRGRMVRVVEKANG
jgi:hypothetical protein